jgi:hypothetical protein
MRYDVCTPESKERIGDIILDKSLQKGDPVRFKGTDWRIRGIVWERDPNDRTNSVSSGLLCIEPIEPKMTKTAPIVLYFFTNLRSCFTPREKSNAASKRAELAIRCASCARRRAWAGLQTARPRFFART